MPIYSAIGSDPEGSTDGRPGSASSSQRGARYASPETPIFTMSHYYSRVLILFVWAGNALVEVGRMWVSSVKQAG